ncbi:restriction endonuclease subunit S [Holdemanella biformis]|uniref:restriction endonuclease subunit S n=1 Tax=Holdemanella biformis TaxID=1735 RepID=UPI003A91C321
MVNYDFLSVYFYSVPNLRFSYKGDWSKRKLNEICQFFKGNGLSKSDLSNEGFPCILYGELYTTYKNEVISDIISKTNTTLSNPFLSRNNDLIIPGSGEDPIDIAVARAICQNDIILGGDLNILRPKSNVSAAFLSYQLNGVRRYDIAKKAQGKSIVHLHNSDLKEVLVSIPTYNEQLHIVKLLTKVDEMIETQSKIIELKQSLIKDIEDRILWKTTNTQTKPIREFLTEINNKSIIQNQYPLLSSTKKGLFLQTDYFNKEAASSNNIGYKIVHKGDIIISPQNLWMGNITYNDKFDNGLVSPSYRIYKVKEEYNAFYISRILMSYRALSLYKNISEQGASIVRRNLNVDAFNELCFPIPNIKKQDEVGLFLSKLHQELKCETWILMQLKSQKNYLLNNMFI